MKKVNILAHIDNSQSECIIGRIGGNIPQYFTDKLSEIEGLKFYINFQHPENSQLFISIFVPQEYDVLLENNIYPACAVKVFVHPYTGESTNKNYTIERINQSYIIGFNERETDDFGFITKSEHPKLIQDEECYYKNLKHDDYQFFVQIDEDFYPPDVIDGDYIFGYGALYLYKNKTDESIVAGFWQYS
ncbi:DUF1963 domain-containing protein [Kosakonia sp. BK9b]